LIGSRFRDGWRVLASTCSMHNNSLLLHFASGDVSHVESMLEACADPAFRGRDEQTCLLLAIEDNYDTTAEDRIAPAAAAEAIDARHVNRDHCSHVGKHARSVHGGAVTIGGGGKARTHI